MQNDRQIECCSNGSGLDPMKRLREIRQRYDESRAALEKWEREEENQLRSEEEFVHMMEDAVDTEATEHASNESCQVEVAKSDDAMASLYIEAEKLLSEGREKSSEN